MRRVAFFMLATVFAMSAEDWPEWRGKGRLGVWNEAGVPALHLTYERIQF